MKIGILSLQGDFCRHQNIIADLGWDSMLVRYQYEFSKIDGLVIPGGESTTLTKLLRMTGLFKTLKDFSLTHPILGTCAGLILMSRKCDDLRVEPLKILDVDVRRNAFGRQVDSFESAVNLTDGTILTGTFIRAPKIIRISKNVEILAKFNGTPVAVRDGKHIGISFHPELNNESIFHKLAFYSSQSKKKYKQFGISYVN